MNSLNIDASLIKSHHHSISHTKESLIQLQNGCICCTLRGDLLSELARLTTQDGVEYVVIESTGISEPMQVAETFTAEFSAAMLEAGGDSGLGLEDLDGESRKIVEDMYVFSLSPHLHLFSCLFPGTMLTKMGLQRKIRRSLNPHHPGHNRHRPRRIQPPP